MDPYSRVPEREAACHEMVDIFMPALRYVAKSCGYALGLHGTLARDIDIIAVPWRENPISPEGLIENIREVVKAVAGLDSVTVWEEKPCGRRAIAIHLTHDYGNGPYLDISIMPPPETKPKLKKGKSRG